MTRANIVELTLNLDLTSDKRKYDAIGKLESDKINTKHRKLGLLLTKKERKN